MASVLFLIIGLVAGAVAGAGLGYWIVSAQRRGKVSAAERRVADILAEAETKGKTTVLEGKEEVLKFKAQAEQEVRDRRKEVQQLERRLSQKEDQVDRKLDSLERRDRTLAQKQQELDAVRLQVDEVKKQQLEQLQAVAQMPIAEARDLLLRKVDEELEHDKAKRIFAIEQQIQADAEMKARKAITLAIQRLTSDVVSETSVTVVPLPSDDMKGRIIGREGRNIRALEAATGVDLIIDDTPEAITVSCFDPVRREVARLALEKLLLDGRIHPTRIEEMVERTQKEVDEIIRKAGEQAVLEAGVRGLNHEIVKLLGRLKYRYSYGQNQLKHAIECAHLAGIMAAEIGANVQVSKAGALLHDLGKALSHEIEGPHAEIGGEIARKYGIPNEIARAIEEHHAEGETINVEAFLVAAADAISGARPGARRDSVERYVKRLQDLEKVAAGFPGVEKTYAIQAGREVRIMVKPEQVDDVGSSKLAHDIAKKIEDTLVFPGQIKVTVVRETRATTYAK
ncbi:MAG: ribonuclease Y [Chloroflexi bacterium]|nr:ribonuclease Y [Chloroflexota bacterium]